MICAIYIYIPFPAKILLGKENGKDSNSKQKLALQRPAEVIVKRYFIRVWFIKDCWHTLGFRSHWHRRAKTITSFIFIYERGYSGYIVGNQLFLIHPLHSFHYNAHENRKRDVVSTTVETRNFGQKCVMQKLESQLRKA